MTNMRSLEPKCFLPDGTEFKTWEPAHIQFSRTYFVDQNHVRASDQNPGTSQLPFRTIGQAAQALQPGERVVIESGVYREWVCPARGGTDPEHMISYEAAPGAQVIIKGSELLQAKWVKSAPWLPDEGPKPADASPGQTGDAGKPKPARLWMVRLPRGLFDNYNPFAMINYPQIDELGYWDLKYMFSKPAAHIYLQVRGHIFQNGRYLEQVSAFSDLARREGAFWAEADGRTLHITTYGDIDPNDAQWELTTREQCFAPEEYGLNHIRVKGLTMELAGNGFPFPQRGALSVMHGTHWLIEDNTIRWVNGVGMDLGRQGGQQMEDAPTGWHIVRRNEITDCGICGIAGAPLTDSLIEDNYLRRNAWLDAELMAECAAIKIHWNINALIRRNLIIDTVHGTGIYLDCLNQNCRITQNTVIDSGSLNTMAPGPGQGAIYLEATSGPCTVDNNFVWGSSKTNGIYGYCSGNSMIAHNLVGQCVAGGIVMDDEPGRPEGNPGGGNQIVNNIFVDNGWNIDLFQPKNKSDYNLFGQAQGSGQALQIWENEKQEDVMATLKAWHMAQGPSYYEWRLEAGAFNLWQDKQRLDLAGWRAKYDFDWHSAQATIKAQLDREKLVLTWLVQGEIPGCQPLEGVTIDFPAGAIQTDQVAPGPFNQVPRTFQSISVDPRWRD